MAVLSSQQQRVDTSSLVSFVDLNPATEDFLSAVLGGLSKSQKELPCKFFYDERGSQIFDQICDLDEYYPTRTEIGILEDRLGEIAELVGRGAHLVELGSGASTKIRTLLNALPDLAQYTAIDISRDFLLQSAATLAEDYPDLDVAAICADYTTDFEIPAPVGRRSSRTVAFFPGSTIGNFTPDEAKQFLKRMVNILGKGSGLLIGVDLKKDVSLLRAAYNDAKGVTAAFNMNLLSRINGELGANFDLDSFYHDAVYVEDLGRIEMRLISRKKQSVTIGGETFTFDENEFIHTENSHKFSLDEVRNMCTIAGFTPVASWADSKSLFSVHYFTAE
ncbi:MAG: dimethylhistidine N-methyltransferase [Paracoccaceae bacterium]|jgi:dimethylhistidine N-methyltransferase